jgi:hypothetical protein
MYQPTCGREDHQLATRSTVTASRYLAASYFDCKKHGDKSRYLAAQITGEPRQQEAQ